MKHKAFDKADKALRERFAKAYYAKNDTNPKKERSPFIQVYVGRWHDNSLFYRVKGGVIGKVK
ncbi:hypothetical protein [Leptolyngbya sp. Cla-17]|uniref:hypothetical protein n=1 Tax=Leptolyngbya sp. Cla-17 TaxID=2803751 RepID=UPI001490A224|nr:hypothetical protein [Leptolyngbya sp. Cla-17]